MTTATVLVPGTCGELVQGWQDGVAFHVSCPIDRFAAARVTVGTADGPVSAPPGASKAARALRRALEMLGIPEAAASLRLISALPHGLGMGSSTADVAGAISAAGLAIGLPFSPGEIARLALAVEPTDGSVFPGLALFDHREGRVQELLGPPPPLALLVLEFPGAVDTVAFNRIDRRGAWQRRVAAYREALEMLRAGLAASDMTLVGTAATLSAMANQALLPKPAFEEVRRLAAEIDALGVVAAHSGSVLGLLLDPRRHDLAAAHAYVAHRLPPAVPVRLQRLIGGGVRPLRSRDGRARSAQFHPPRRPCPVAPMAHNGDGSEGPMDLEEAVCSREAAMDDILLAIRRPLEFAARNDYANVMALRGLERTVERVIDRGLSLAPDAAARHRLQAIRAALSGFDSQPAEGRRARIETARKLLDGPIAAAPEPPTRAARAPMARPRRTATAAKPMPAAPPPSGDPMSVPIQFVKGVGPKVAEALVRKGLATVEDALYFLPRTYEDRRRPVRIGAAEPGTRVVVLGEVVASGVAFFGGRRRGYEMAVSDGSGVVHGRWFYPPGGGFQSRFPKGTRVLVSGDLQRFAGKLSMVHPDVEPADGGGDAVHFNRIVPIYSEAEGVPQKSLRRILKSVVDACAGSATGSIPPAVARDLALLPLPEALRAVHFPPEDADTAAYLAARTPAHRTLIMDELFALQLGLAMRRRGLALEPAPVLRGDGRLVARLRERLPFALTRAQERAGREIAADLESGHPMHRLLQGDVGSGKTLVALLAALTAVESGHQAAMMAPTELLAEQHYLTAHRLLAPLGLEVLLLTGAQGKSERAKVLRRIEQGDTHLVVGTHAVIQDQVAFKRLGLGIVDEQHRFGVAQRATLAKKGERPHLLVMTATPIPRTLAMTVYGDLEVSILDELPPGRSPIGTTVIWPKQRREVTEAIRVRIARGEQAYVVYPLVEESEAPELADLKDATQAADDLAQALPGVRVGLLHGRMGADEKESVMVAFRDRRIDLLVATTVIEVGIDVPNATLMVIEHAERFGLSQLHQLRGRVGRGSKASACLLVATGRRTEEAARRLAVMEQTTDGFLIAEADLEIRGPGDFLGTRQSGIPDFRVANLFRDQRLLVTAREAAFALVARDPDLADPAHRGTRDAVRRRWAGRLSLAGV